MVSGLVGASLAPDPSLATVPLGLFIAGAAFSTYPASMLMGRIGRRTGFLIGASIGFYGGVLGAWAVYESSFSLLCFTGLFMGIYFAFGGYYRFAIADVVTGKLKRHAVSIVLAGGVISGVVGPYSADWSRDLLAPQTFMASYAVISALAYLKLLLLAFIDIPTPRKVGKMYTGRPIIEIVRQPRFIVAAIAGMVSWTAMNQLMMAAPIAMHNCSLPFSDAAFVMQWHNFGMFLPGFFTGALANRFGVYNVMLWGALFLFGAVAALVSGIDLWNFWWAGFLVGTGWCFLFVSATIVITECCTVQEQAKTQGFNDFLVFFAQAIGTFGTGALLHLVGWSSVGYTLIPIILLTAGATIWLSILEGTLAPQIRSG
jgi:MFS family permease